MLSKKFVARLVGSLVALIILSIMGFYFLLSSSYQSAIEARFHYMLNDFNLSKELAKKSLEQDRYNRMAMTILAKIDISLEFQEYIRDSKEYFDKINSIINKDSITKADKIKVKMICEIMIEKFEKLKQNREINEDLEQNAKYFYIKFFKIHTDIVNSI